MPFFPRDFPTFSEEGAYEEWRKKREEEQRGRWERRPKAKRESWDKLGTRSPWREDWEVVLGIEMPEKQSEKDKDKAKGQAKDGYGAEAPGGDPTVGEEHDVMSVDMEDPDSGLMSTQRDLPDPVMEQTLTISTTTEKKKGTKPWLLHGPEVATILTTAYQSLNPAFTLLSVLNQFRTKRGMDPLFLASSTAGPLSTVAGLTADDIMDGALVQIRLRMLTRGCPDELAIIYDVGEQEAIQWINASRREKKGEDWDMDAEISTTTEVRTFLLCLKLTTYDPSSYQNKSHLRATSLAM